MAKKKSSNMGCGIIAFSIILTVLATTVIIVLNPDKFRKSKSSSKTEIARVERSANDGSVSTIDEQLLWETSDGVKLTATGLTYNRDGELREINVLAENNSSNNIGIGTNAIIINDYMITDLTSIKVTAGTKTNDKIRISGTALKQAGIDNIGKIEIYLHTFDPDSYNTIEESECITIKTSDYDKMDTENNVAGTPLIDESDVKVYAQYVDQDSFWGAAVVLYIENNTDGIIHVYADDTVVNGYSISSIYAAEIYPGKKDIGTVDFMSSKLEENNITSIDTVDLSIRVMDDSRNEIANSGKVSISTK